MPSFLADVVEGRANPEDIDNYVEAWHVSGLGAITGPLHEYLGMTFEQYARWVQHPAEFAAIIDEYKASQRGDSPCASTCTQKS